MGEAVFLHTPMLAVPLSGQFEQTLNARYLAREGFGAAAETLDDPATVHDFVAKIPEYESKLASYGQKDNSALLGAVDEFLDRAAAGLV